MIPSIGVDTGPLVGLGVDSHGALEVPRRYEQAGWYIPGLAPGQYGPAVIAGHVDSTTGPAVFYRLSALHTGAVVTVRRGHLALAAATAGDLCRFGVHTAARCRVDAEVIPVTRRLHAERITAPMADASTAVSSDSLVNLLRVYWSGRW